MTMQCTYKIEDAKGNGFWRCLGDEGHDGEHIIPSAEHCKTTGEWFH